MTFFPPYDDLAEGAVAPPPAKSRPVVVVDSMEKATGLLERLAVADIAAIGLDSHDALAWSERSSPGGMRSRRQPVCLSIAALLNCRKGESGIDRLLAVVDLRVPGISDMVGRVLRFRTPFIAHGLNGVLQTFWALGLEPDMPQVVDTQIVALCLNLGRYRKRAVLRSQTLSEAARIAAEESLNTERHYAASLVGQSAVYGLGYPYSEVKEVRRTMFPAVGSNRPLSPREIEDAAAEAEWTLKLYVAQQPDILNAGLAHHLYTVEFPFAVANARMEWRGVNVDRDRCRSVRSAAVAARKHHAEALAKHGIANPDDSDEVRRYLYRQGLLPAHHRGALDDDLLQDLEDQDPVVAELRQYRKARSLIADDLFAGIYYGADGRVHPSHVQLGAATGRNTCVSPNVAGISRRFRPIVTAPARRALIELDYGQFEIGVAAAEHDDPDLIAAYNDGDVYVAMAKRFYGVGQDLDVSEFKKRHRDHRDAMKTMVLAVIYNIGPRALAKRLGVSVKRAGAERAKFLDTFPALKAGLERSRSDGLARGYATTISGLRRRIEWPIADLPWTKNFLSNTPIQGSAAVVFKRAIIDLDAAFRRTNTWLVLPIHDAVLIECDIDMIDEVIRLATEIMKSAMRHFYPRLEPRVEVNRRDPTCWNKDGDTQSILDFVNRFTPSSCESSS